MKQKKYIAGLYFRLSQEDERQGESASIEHQRTILRKYAEEHGFEIHDEYIDDGISGTTFDRPQVQRLLDDAKTGVINTIIVKDLSRFGRNYIEVGQYIDYVFPAFGIRFIAIQDNVDTENRDSGTMEMMPIMNVFTSRNTFNSTAERADADSSEFRAKIVVNVPNVGKSVIHIALRIKHFVPFFFVVRNIKKFVAFSEFRVLVRYCIYKAVMFFFKFLDFLHKFGFLPSPESAEVFVETNGIVLLKAFDIRLVDV